MTTTIEQIKNAINIVDVIAEYLDLQKKGTNYWAVCPFHEDTNPSMSISPQKQFFKCFACGASGDVIRFVADYEKIPILKAAAKMAQRVGMDYQITTNTAKYNQHEQAIINALRDAHNFFMLALDAPEGSEALAYAQKRGLDQNLREKFDIGYASEQVITFLEKKGHDRAVLINASLLNDNDKPFFKKRLIFGIRNEWGDIVGFSARALKEGETKYINSQQSIVFNKSQLLYNYFNAQDYIAKNKVVYIAEGFMDVIALDRAQQSNVVALMGTALTNKHLGKLKHNEVILWLDADAAGILATLKSIYLLLSHKIKVKVVKNDTGQDPDEIFAHGQSGAIKKLLNSPETGLEFVYRMLKTKINEPSLDNISKFINKFKRFLIFGSPLECDFFIHKMASEFNLSLDNPLFKMRLKNQNLSQVKIVANHQSLSTKTNRLVYNPQYSYQLVKSLIKKPFLAKLLVTKQKVQLHDPVILGIVKFLVAKALNQDAIISAAGKAKLFEINQHTKEYAHNEKEFLDIINVINKKWKSQLMTKIKVKLNNASNKKEAAEYLEQLKKIGKR